MGKALAVVGAVFFAGGATVHGADVGHEWTVESFPDDGFAVGFVGEKKKPNDYKDGDTVLHYYSFETTMKEQPKGLELRAPYFLSHSVLVRRYPVSEMRPDNELMKLDVDEGVKQVKPISQAGVAGIQFSPKDGQFVRIFARNRVVYKIRVAGTRITIHPESKAWLDSWRLLAPTDK